MESRRVCVECDFYGKSTVFHHLFFRSDNIYYLFLDYSVFVSAKFGSLFDCSEKLLSLSPFGCRGVSSQDQWSWVNVDSKRCASEAYHVKIRVM